MPMFSGRILQTLKKYNILWFVVDIYYRERYFFICGC